jgi:hypothetical protein
MPISFMCFFPCFPIMPTFNTFHVNIVLQTYINVKEAAIQWEKYY